MNNTQLLGSEETIPTGLTQPCEEYSMMHLLKISNKIVLPLPHKPTTTQELMAKDKISVARFK